MVHLHIFPIIFISGKICKWTITWTDFRSFYNIQFRVTLTEKKQFSFWGSPQYCHTSVHCMLAYYKSYSYCALCWTMGSNSLWNRIALESLKIHATFTRLSLLKTKILKLRNYSVKLQVKMFSKFSCMFLYPNIFFQFELF